MASISFWAAGDNQIYNLSGSGLGFYGSTFGQSIAVSEYNQTTYITSSDGTALGPQANNVKYQNIGSGIVGSSSSGIPLISIPNYQASLRIRFNHSTAVKLQNSQVRIYDRNSIDASPSGASWKIAQIIHPSTSQVPVGSGNSTWVTVFGSGSVLSLTHLFGLSGLAPNGIGTYDYNHDAFFALSVSPDSISSKTAALYFSCEYL